MKKRSKSFICYIVFIVVLMVVFVSLMIWEWASNMQKVDYPFFTTEFAKMALSLLQTVLIALLVTGELRRNSKITQQALDLESQGITGVNKDGVLKPREIRDLFTHAKLIKIMGVCSRNFLMKNEEKVEMALKRGCEIRLLIANENSDFVKETTEQLEASKSREYNVENNQAEEIRLVLKKIKEWQNFGWNISVRQFNTEFRTPFYLGYFDESDDDIKVKGWYNSVIPVCSPREVLMFKGEILESEREKYITLLSDKTDGEDHNYTISNRGKKRNFVIDLECHFDYLWRKYKTQNASLEEYLNSALKEINNLKVNTIFIVKDLFQGNDWEKISSEDRAVLGRMFNTEIKEKYHNIQPLGKTIKEQQQYVKLK